MSVFHAKLPVFKHSKSATRNVTYNRYNTNQMPLFLHNETINATNKAQTFWVNHTDLKITKSETFESNRFKFYSVTVDNLALVQLPQETDSLDLCRTNAIRKKKDTSDVQISNTQSNQTCYSMQVVPEDKIIEALKSSKTNLNQTILSMLKKYYNTRPSKRSEKQKMYLKDAILLGVKQDAINLILKSRNSAYTLDVDTPDMAWPLLLDKSKENRGKVAQELLAIGFDLHANKNTQATFRAATDTVFMVLGTSHNKELGYTSCKIDFDLDTLYKRFNFGNEPMCDKNIDELYNNILPVREKLGTLFSELVSRNCMPCLASETFKSTSSIGIACKTTINELNNSM